MEAYTRNGRKMLHNHCRTIKEALETAHPGDTIELGDGHYWVNEDLTVEFPIKIVGDEHNPSNVTVELSGTLRWQGRRGWCEGITFRRPKIAGGKPFTSEMLRLENGGRCDVFQSVFDNEGSSGSAVTVTGDSKSYWKNVVVKSQAEGISFGDGGLLELIKCRVE